MKKQVLIIHGGTTFESHDDYLNNLINSNPKLERMKPGDDWKRNLQANLGDEFDVYTPSMPQKDNAHYKEWKLYFEKILPLLDDEIILIGHSLGSVFLVKFLSENNINKTIRGLFLVAPPFADIDETGESISDFRLEDENFSNLVKQTEKIFIYHSKDDPVVPYQHSEKYKELIPNSKLTILEDRGHFNDDNFPEILEDLKSVNPVI